MGGVLAYEVAQLLHQKGERVGLLANLDSPGPGDTEVIRGRLNTEDVFREYFAALSPEAMATIEAGPASADRKLSLHL